LENPAVFPIAIPAYGPYNRRMWETLASPGALQIAGFGMAWLVTISLMLVGLIGCVVPVLPGPPILFIAALGHRLMLGADGSGLSWWTILGLGVVVAVVQVIDIVSGAAGAKWFGGSKWGSLGALLGGFIGLFFLPIGLLVGPLVGAIGFEMMFAKKEPNPALVSGVGSLAGTFAGMAVKVVCGLIMVGWFVIDVFLIR